MEVEALPPPLQQHTTTTRAHMRSPEGLRQRQRDRLAPRGPRAKDHPLAMAARDLQNATSTAGVTFSPAPRRAGAVSPQRSRKRRKEKEEQLAAYALPRTKTSLGDIKKGDITPDGGSAGREGRQFAVANVGHNGKIYLRPTIRPVNQRFPQPPFVFPITPPGTAGLDTLATQNDETASHRDSLWSSTNPPSATIARRPGEAHIPGQHTELRHRPLPHIRRPHSLSTLGDEQGAIQYSDLGAFKVVIERPPPDSRPKSAEESSPSSVPFLEIPIPSYKLGTPRFSMRGTPFLRGSSYAPTDDMRSSSIAPSGTETPVPRRGSPRNDFGRARSQSDLSSLRSHEHRLISPIGFDASSPLPMRLRDSSSPGSLPIVQSGDGIRPSMFDALTFKPACDDRSVVRYSSNTGALTAGTPARIVAELTLHLDYDLASDFFLMYRFFLAPEELLALLFARLRWAIDRGDNLGMIVRVRAFVVLRHWILNYFADDFALDYNLRIELCNYLNDWVADLLQMPAPDISPLQIMKELSTSWNSQCSLLWDLAKPSSVIKFPFFFPGGILGSRNANLHPSFYLNFEQSAPQLDNVLDLNSSQAAGKSFAADVSRAGHHDSTYVAAPRRGESESEEDMVSTDTATTFEANSCSFPSKFKNSQHGPSEMAGAHPIAASSAYGIPPHVAHAPKGLNMKRGRADHAHKRSRSFAETRRDSRPSAPSYTTVKGETFKFVDPYAQRLLYGMAIAPGQAFVEMIAPSTPAVVIRDSPFKEPDTSHTNVSGMSGNGFKKILGSVRRAFLLKPEVVANPSPTLGSFPQMLPFDVRGATVHRMMGPPVVPEARARNTGAPAPKRLDILGARVLEDFNKVIRQVAAARAERRAELNRSSRSSAGAASGSREMFPETSGEFSNGSNSIIIVDDTARHSLPIMTGALPANPSTDAFTDAFRRHSAVPTPPSTPPGQYTDSPRRSSHALAASSIKDFQPLSPERMPSLTLDSSPSVAHHSRHRPTVGSISHSHRSAKSVSLRRYASYQSNLTRGRNQHSFDATSFSESAGLHLPPQTMPPPPPPMLRRRPGGDLRAVTNVGDLNMFPIRRTQSTGSMTTYMESVRSSVLNGHGSMDIVNVVSSEDYSHIHTGNFSLGALAEVTTKKSVSLFSTHSSQPVMRPSFEAEAAKLAQIPDDDHDDGGVESALLKLEGKFTQRQPDLAKETPLPDVSSSAAENIGGDEKRRHRQNHVIEQNIAKKSPMPETYHPHQVTDRQQEPKPVAYKPLISARPTQKSRPLTEESYSSIPILEREVSYEFDGSRNWTGMSMLRGPSKERKTSSKRNSEESHPSIDMVDETESMRRIPVGETLPRNESGQSFLEDPSDDDSDISSAMSMEFISRKERVETDSFSTYPPLRAGTVITEVPLAHPLRHPSGQVITLGQAFGTAATARDMPASVTEQLRGQAHKRTPTPEAAPNLKEKPAASGKKSRETENKFASPRDVKPPFKVPAIASVHLAFVLQFPSTILAQQFTLVEKDALLEIDWKELVDMNWKEAPVASNSWVHLIRSYAPHGVELVVARFNMMVKWVISEIVLTQDLTERVQTIVKFIHIAAECRKIRNFATMYQIIAALASQDLAPLIKTWFHVPEIDLATFKELEELVSPIHNFQRFRSEMESAGAETGCIPFIGIYTHDLLVTAQKPSQIASTPTAPPLVNFTRYRTMAGPVKSLLVLIEGSRAYRYEPVEGIIERCVWICSLSDAEIASYVKTVA